MKGKKTTLANNSTGYTRKQNGNKKTSGNQIKSEANHTKQKVEENVEQDQDLNSGFGDYLRSPEAVEMMKLFVFANSIMLILTMAWPNIKEQYYMLMHWIATFQMQ